jgi:RES domain-containing protein
MCRFLTIIEPPARGENSMCISRLRFATRVLLGILVLSWTFLPAHAQSGLGRAELIDLGVDWDHYGSSRVGRTQVIGAAVAHLEFDGLIAPSARWACDNVILFLTRHDAPSDDLVVRGSVEVDWRQWMGEHTSDGE